MVDFFAHYQLTFIEAFRQTLAVQLSILPSGGGVISPRNGNLSNDVMALLQAGGARLLQKYWASGRKTEINAEHLPFCTFFCSKLHKKKVCNFGAYGEGKKLFLFS